MAHDACSHPARAAASEADVEAALGMAETRSLERGFQWTGPRRRVYELMLKAGGPVKAYDLMEVFSDSKPAKPPTVYRALDFLEQQGLVHRIPSLNAYVACGAPQAGHAAAFLICDCCGSAQEFEPGQTPDAARAAAAYGFTPRAMSLEVRGVCARCTPAN